MSADTQPLEFKEKLGFGIGDAGIGMYFHLLALFQLSRKSEVG